MRKPNRIIHAIYLYFQDKFQEVINYEVSQVVTHNKLNYVMTDRDGHKYFEYPNGYEMPLKRHMKVDEYINWMQSGLDAETLTEICDQAQYHVMEALKLHQTPKKQASELAKVTALIKEIGDRKDRIVPFDLIINALCAQIVREDEDPNDFNEKIHAEKIQYFAEYQTRYSFFFQFRAFKSLVQALNVSEENWIQYLTRQTAQLKALRESLTISSMSKESSKGSVKR